MTLCIIATPEDDYRSWNYLIGNFHTSRSIGLERVQFLRSLAVRSGGDLKLALLDVETREGWTKWTEYYKCQYDLQVAYDVHRSVLDNEIVIESDYPTYEENDRATRIIGAILENKGFIPHYYYSGSKSIHCHVYLDWTCLFTMDKYVQEAVIAKHGSANIFKRKFMEWIRANAIACWGTGARTFDEQLVKASHLIRAELSRNKHGYKTFLGYTYKDIPPFPIICNETNGVMPELGEIRESRPVLIQEIVEEYLTSLDKKKVAAKAKHKERALDFYLHGSDDPAELKGCVKFLLSDEFRTAGDGFRRAMFYLANELKRLQGERGIPLLLEWNARNGSPVKEQDIMYLFARQQTYSLGHETIHSFLRTLGFKEVEATCESLSKQEKTKP